MTRFESFSASPLFDDTSYKPSDRSEGRANNELGSEGTTWTTSKRFDDDPNATSTTSSSSYIENASSITSTRFPTIFTCSRYFNVKLLIDRADNGESFPIFMEKFKWFKVASKCLDREKMRQSSGLRGQYGRVELHLQRLFAEPKTDRHLRRLRGLRWPDGWTRLWQVYFPYIFQSCRIKYNFMGNFYLSRRDLR